MFKKAKQLVRTFKQELTVYQRVLRDPRTPRRARWLLAAAIAYFLSPIDLIPDWIPVLGQLDDLVIVPLLVFLALRLIPREIVAEHRHAVRQAAKTAETVPPAGHRARHNGGI